MENETKKPVDKMIEKARNLIKERDVLVDKFIEKYPDTNKDLHILLMNLNELEIRIDRYREKIHKLDEKDISE